MKLVCTLICLQILICTRSFSQTSKPPVDSSLYDIWPSIEQISITNDGRFVAYSTKNYPQPGMSVATLASTKKSFRKSFDTYDFSFSTNSEDFVYKDFEDSLFVFSLRSKSRLFITRCSGFSVVDYQGTSLIFANKPENSCLAIYDIHGKNIYNLAQVISHKFITDGEHILILGGNEKKDWILKLNITSKATDTITVSEKISQYLLNKDETQVAILKSKANKNVVEIFDLGNDKLIRSFQSDRDKSPNRINGFSSDGKRVFVNFEKKGTGREDNVNLNIWNYKDPIPQEQQVSSLEFQNSYQYVLNMDTGEPVQLRRDEEEIAANITWNDQWALSTLLTEASGQTVSYKRWLTSCQNGYRKVIDLPTENAFLCPEFNYLVYFDEKQSSYFSYDIEGDFSLNISGSISSKFGTKMGMERLPGIAGWINSEKEVLVYSKFDIWKLDLTGKHLPVNVTNRYGEENSTVISLMSGFTDVITETDEIIASAFNTKTKDNGYFIINLIDSRKSSVASIGPYIHYLRGNGIGREHGGILPIRAANANTYVATRQSSNAFPNLFCTTDFSEFKQLSFLEPHKNYNWYTTELLKWKSKSGIPLDGILYKPENFDPKKSYPVILHYYTTKSEALNLYLSPWPSNGGFNILWYVSNGYLVFTPDVHLRYPKDNPWRNSYQSVLSARDHLKGLGFVDSTKIGIQGISMGGIQTNYIITKTNAFAAANTSSSIADFVSDYNGYRGYGNNAGYELQGNRTLWENPDWYISNSPVMNADKVTTPLLMFHTTTDGACPFENAREFYSALRRIGRKVWLLEYEDGDHGVHGLSARDFDQRQHQFFNYYLKGSPPPKWMTIGRPATQKNSDQALALDYSENKP